MSKMESILLATFLFIIIQYDTSRNGFALARKIKPAASTDNLKFILSQRPRSNQEYESAVLDLISRLVPQYSDDFLVKIDENLNEQDVLLDTFELEMVNQNRKLLIKANTAVAAAWGFNYYLKYYCNSSINWSGRNINIQEKLPVVTTKIRITATDYIRFYQNVCTYSYSYVWWDWNRWEMEIDWAALNGINLVYAQTAAEFAFIRVFTDMGFSQKEINQFFTGKLFFFLHFNSFIKNLNYIYGFK
jgi:alpha-N-acetylglucosaminidase